MVHETKKISAGFCATLAILLLCLPFRWVAAAAIAALVHEMGHFGAISCLSGKGAKIRFQAFSARMAMPEMSLAKELICALAGPVTGLCLLPLSRYFPRIAICALGQSIYNLMPIYPLDGGRVLRCFASMLLSPPSAQKCCTIVEIICRIVVLAVGIFLSCLGQFGMIPILVAGIVVIPRK